MASEFKFLLIIFYQIPVFAFNDYWNEAFFYKSCFVFIMDLSFYYFYSGYTFLYYKREIL